MQLVGVDHAVEGATISLAHYRFSEQVVVAAEEKATERCRTVKQRRVIQRVGPILECGHYINAA